MSLTSNIMKDYNYKSDYPMNSPLKHRSTTTTSHLDTQITTHKNDKMADHQNHYEVVTYWYCVSLSLLPCLLT